MITIKKKNTDKHNDNNRINNDINYSNNTYHCQ